MHNHEDINYASLDYHFDDVYDEASFRCDLKHSSAERRSAAEAADVALRRLAQLRAANENAPFDETYENVFDKKLIERDLVSSDEMLRFAARTVVHELVGLFDMRLDDRMERETSPPLRSPTADDIEREHLRRIIQDRAEWARSRLHGPRRSRAALKLV